MMNPNILNKNPLMFFDRAVNAQRSQLLTVMADAVSECRTAADQAAELNETGQVGLIRLAEIWSAIRAKEDVYKRQVLFVKGGGSIMEFEQIYNTYFKAVYRYIWQLSGNEHIAEMCIRDRICSPPKKAARMQSWKRFRKFR